MSNRRKIKRSTVARLFHAHREQDTRYFERNPDKRGYTRPATPDELAGGDFPPGTRVYVHLIGYNHRARAFIPPTESRRN